MGLEKLGTTIGKEVIAWTRTSASKSLLATKPIKVNTSGLRFAPKLEDDVVQISNSKKVRTILNIKKGTQEPIVFSKLPDNIDLTGGYNIYTLDAFNIDGELIGRLSFKGYENIFDELEALYIKYFGTSNEYKGIGTEMVRQIVSLSNKLGLKGNVRLSACTGSIPQEFQFKGISEKCKTSAAIKYKKMGFAANRLSIDRRINEKISEGDTGIIQDPRGASKDIFGSVAMHLSEDAIQRYLKGI